MVTGKKVRLAFIGLGGMGQAAHLCNYAVHPEVEIVAAADLRPVTAKLVAARYGISRLYKDHRELLDAALELDGIVAIQPFHIHGRLIPDILRRGVPVLIEKPLALSAEVGESIAAAARTAGTPLYVAYHKRSDPAIIHARQLTETWRRSGEFGRLKYIRLTMPPGPWPSPTSGYDTVLNAGDPYPRLEPDAHRTGMPDDDVQRLIRFVNYYIHQVNLLRHLLGEDYRVAYADPAGVVLAARSVSGVPAVIEMAPHSSRSQWQEQALVTFERAWVRVDLPGPLTVNAAGRLIMFLDAENQPRAQVIEPCLPQVHAMRQQANHFVSAIRGEATPLCTATEALKDLMVARDYLNMCLHGVRDAEERQVVDAG